ncbi:hypothetical protein [Rathayibacter sp. VKM Ac-2760]|uniref:hypothetical protein n=1 Tax=Rathayibacter sp. VKM Ac-2760 TaxID=2609253 RepID=UPI001316A852|nr:hypothetical protein [Rathayibacter sp. VKM Ac-2760]QHC57776.1 hypothetical protein GSU72_03700 [Rathayibacter sp. VKM Ac-2760]
MKRRHRAWAVLLAAPVLLAGGCAAPGQRQDPTLCPPLAESWNAFVADPVPEKRAEFESALDAFAHDSSTSTASHAARLAKSALLEAAARTPARSPSFWNALDILAEECAAAGAELSFDGRGEPLPAVGG